MRYATIALFVLTGGLTGCGAKSDAQPAPLPAAAAAAAPRVPWRTVQDPSHRFAVALPAGREVKLEPRSAASGYAQEESYLVDVGGQTFGVVTTAYYPEFIRDTIPGQLLATARKAAATEIDGTVLEDQPASLTLPDGAELVGRQVVIESESMKLISRNRWVLHGATLYRLVQSGPVESTSEADFQRMVASFTLTAAAKRR